MLVDLPRQTHGLQGMRDKLVAHYITLKHIICVSEWKSAAFLSAHKKAEFQHELDIKNTKNAKSKQNYVNKTKPTYTFY